MRLPYCLRSVIVDFVAVAEGDNGDQTSGRGIDTWRRVMSQSRKAAWVDVKTSHYVPGEQHLEDPPSGRR